MGRQLPKEILADALWGTDLPRDPKGALRSHIYSLRKALGTSRNLKTGANSCMMQLHDGDVLDVELFRSLTSQARQAQRRHDISSVVRLLGDALEIWDDPPLADVPETLSMQPIIAELIEQRHIAHADLIDAKLALGWHHDLLPSLGALTTAEPLRERSWEQYMLALYRSGRQVEALDVFTRARTVLTEEYGVDPGNRLASLQRRILASDPSLDLRTTAKVKPRPPTGARALARRGQPATARAKPVASPHQLPATVRQFIGRGGDLAALSELVPNPSRYAPPSATSVISGAPGVGKSTLALYFARQVTKRFPSGQFYIDLRGFGPSGPVQPIDAIRSVLRALGVQSRFIPRGLEAAVSLYRTILVRRRILLVLDNALDSSQVRPLLPPGHGCMTIITSRRKLIDLVSSVGAHLLTLDMLAPEEAQRLLKIRLGMNGLTVKDETMVRLSESCDRLPLALAMAATRAVIHPLVPLEHMILELNDRGRPLDAFPAEYRGTDIRTVFSWSYEKLDCDAAYMFRWLGGPAEIDISVTTCAQLMSISVDQATAALEKLSRENLISECAPGRYYMHGLIRAYASEK